MRPFRRQIGWRAAAAVAVAAGAAALGSLAGASTAHADPSWGGASAKVFTVAGSNTVQDILDAYSGFAPTPSDATACTSATASTCNYHAFSQLADPATGEGIYSWDAVNEATNAEDCIATKPGFTPIARPNGSTDGATALSDEIAGVAWNKATNPAGCVNKTLSGDITIGRSSSGPGATAACTFAGANCLAWVPFAHEGLSYAYVVKSGTTLTTAQLDQIQEESTATLQSLYTSQSTGTFTDPQGTTLAACLPQLGSGTEKAFVTLVGGPVTVATAENSATSAHSAGFEENGGNTFDTTAVSAFTADASDTPAPVVAITAFSVANWIAQANHIGFDRTSTGIAAGVNIAFIDGDPTCTGGCDSPVTGTAPNLAPNTTYYAGHYGRDMWVELDNKVLNGALAQRNNPLRNIFGTVATGSAAYAGASGTVNVAPVTDPYGSATPAICSAPFSTEIAEFGFTPPTSGACGAETLTLLFPTGPGA